MDRHRKIKKRSGEKNFDLLLKQGYKARRTHPQETLDE